MKIRTIAAAAAAIVILAACGGRESTQPATRTKNAAVDAATCAQGGSCKVGDIGPGGGIVFYASPTPQPWGQYMEVSQKTLDPTFDTMWCDVEPTDAFPNSDALGNGRATTEFYAKFCTRGLLRMATELVQGNYDDWHLPTLADAKELFKVRDIVKLEGLLHFTATPNFADGKREVWAIRMVEGLSLSLNPVGGLAGRAIRTFAPVVDPTTTPPTTQGASCAMGGKCKIGDVGPGWGVVFYVAPAPASWGQYLEAARADLKPNVFCRQDPLARSARLTQIPGGILNTQTLELCASSLARDAGALVLSGKSDWYLPSRDEMSEMIRVRKALRLTDGMYATSSEYDASNVWIVSGLDGSPSFGPKAVPRIGRAIRAF